MYYTTHNQQTLVENIALHMYGENHLALRKESEWNTSTLGILVIVSINPLNMWHKSLLIPAPDISDTDYLTSHKSFQN